MICFYAIAIMVRCGFAPVTLPYRLDSAGEGSLPQSSMPSPPEWLIHRVRERIRWKVNIEK